MKKKRYLIKLMKMKKNCLEQKAKIDSIILIHLKGKDLNLRKE